MSEGIGELWSAAREWAASLQESGWLMAADVGRFDAIERSTAADLFDSEKHRPLVIAFFGGTGVGKSSLLNRLAGAEIARTGVERPTSREVTLYLHRSVQLRQLPPGFPADKASIASHENDDYRQILWIDMPDIDSIELANRALALAWLPHIDLLIYVVSPERYRDDQGWKLLRSQRASHAWLFVINQWDMGHPAQKADFTKLLQQGGFESPVIFCTDCRPAGIRHADEFERIRACIGGIANRHVMEQLADHIERSRLKALAEAVQACVEKLGGEGAFEQLREAWDRIWREVRTSLLRGLEWPARSMAQAFLKRSASAPVKPREPDAGSAIATGADTLLWDLWAERAWGNALDRLVLQADSLGVPVPPLQRGLRTVRPRAADVMLDRAHTGLRHALAERGDRLQRLLRCLAGILIWALPLSAMSWVAYRVVTQYYESSVEAQFLGVNFAVHSGMLIFVAWLLPHAAKRALRPSPERLAEKGIREGVHQGLAELGQIVDAVLEQAATERSAHRLRGAELHARASAIKPEMLDAALAHLVAGGKEP